MAAAAYQPSFRPSEARAGIQCVPRKVQTTLDSRFRGNDEEGQTPVSTTDHCQLNHQSRQLRNDFTSHIGQAVHAAIVKIRELSVIQP